MASSPEIEVFSTKREAAYALASLVSYCSEASIAGRGRFTIALAGGSTPATLYRALALPLFARDIDWSRWHVFWGDERCVPPDHPDSNYGMARRALLDRVPIPPSQVHRMHGEAPPDQAAAHYERTLHDVLGPGGRLDLVLLGMGDDGHTASLFPNTVALDERDRLVVANWVPHLNDYRLTLTLPAINAARTVAVFVTGASKAKAVRRALAPVARDETPPIAFVAPVDGPTCWFLTESAYSSFWQGVASSASRRVVPAKAGTQRGWAVEGPTTAHAERPHHSVRPEPVEGSHERSGPHPTGQA